MLPKLTRPFYKGRASCAYSCTPKNRAFARKSKRFGEARPDRLFTIIAGGKYVWSTALEFALIPVLNRSAGVDLRGKTVQIVMTRD